MNVLIGFGRYSLSIAMRKWLKRHLNGRPVLFSIHFESGLFTLEIPFSTIEVDYGQLGDRESLTREFSELFDSIERLNATIQSIEPVRFESNDETGEFIYYPGSAATRAVDSWGIFE